MKAVHACLLDWKHLLNAASLLSGALKSFSQGPSETLSRDHRLWPWGCLLELLPPPLCAPSKENPANKHLLCIALCSTFGQFKRKRRQGFCFHEEGDPGGDTGHGPGSILRGQSSLCLWFLVPCSVPPSSPSCSSWCPAPPSLQRSLSSPSHLLNGSLLSSSGDSE